MTSKKCDLIDMQMKIILKNFKIIKQDSMRQIMTKKNPKNEPTLPQHILGED